MMQSMKTFTNSAIKRGVASVAIVAGSMLLHGCDPLVDLALDCIDRDGPEFDKTLLASPILNQVYSETITASIDNEPLDDRFDYEFAVTGRLPAGIETSEIGRQLIFSGTATETGDFPIQVSVEVSHRNGNLDSGLCFTTESQRYDLTVRPI
jgi:hypothetical protein